MMIILLNMYFIFVCMCEGLGEWDPAVGFKIIHTPGHTPGSLCILIDTNKDKVLFTGDSLAYSAGKQRLEGFKRYNKGILYL